MATADTKLYASQENGFKSYVTVGEIQAAVSPAATTSVAGVVKKAAAQTTFNGADAAAINVQLNAWYAKLQTAGLVT
jgi:hypothetical protein